MADDTTTKSTFEDLLREFSRCEWKHDFARDWFGGMRVMTLPDDAVDLNKWEREQREWNATAERIAKNKLRDGIGIGQPYTFGISLPKPWDRDTAYIVEGRTMYLHSSHLATITSIAS